VGSRPAWKAPKTRPRPNRLRIDDVEEAADFIIKTLEKNAED
jgi:hypothetical protein